MKRTIATVALVSMLGCSGAQRGETTAATRPFPAELAQYFDDTVDHIEDVSILGGRSAADWRRQVNGLAQESDLIVTIRVETVTGGEDSNTRSYRLSTVATGQPLKGTLPDDRRVELRVNEGDNGFNSLRANVTRLQSRDYLMFLRWEPEGEAGRRARWHLSPSTAPLIQQVRDALGYLDGEAAGANTGGTTTTTTTSNPR